MKYNIKIHLRKADKSVQTSDVDLSEEAVSSGSWLRADWLTIRGSNGTAAIQTKEIGFIEMVPVSEPKGKGT